jgi:hypothetical protein
MEMCKLIDWIDGKILKGFLFLLKELGSSMIHNTRQAVVNGYRREYEVIRTAT